MHNSTRVVLPSLSLFIAVSAIAQSSSLHYWPPLDQPRQIEYEAQLNSTPLAKSLRAFHDQFASEPHIAGTPGDERMISRLAMSFRMMTLDTQVHEFWAYMSKPIDAAVGIISPDPISLPLKESPIDEDRYSNDPSLPIGFNAYSGSGDVTAEIVYANQGTKEDFETLKKLGVDCTGKIVLARYGGNYRGFKVKFAQEAGAAGLIMYTDPDEAGYSRGVPYPEGGWANETFIQRGSIVTLNSSGDPLTPGVAATKDAVRLDPSEVELPRIPVQPIGYGAALEIMKRMKGRALPPDLVRTWQGGLPLAYRLEGGPDLRVRLMVKQERAITKSANVTGTIWGVEHPEQKIIIGCHHDAWGYGAADPMAGLILVYEAARSFYEAMHNGEWKPARTVVFAAWGAEEHGLIGSTEYCEEFAQELFDGAVAYINLDAAAMGSLFGSSAAPSLKRLIEEATRDVPQARIASEDSETPNTTVHAAWLGDRETPSFGNLGGGSDHVGFYCHLGIPACGLNARGAQGSSYHSLYDNLHWYRKFVGDDYEPAVMLTKIVNLMTVRLANAPLLPLDPVQYATDVKGHVKTIGDRAAELKIAFDPTSLINRIDEYEQVALATRAAMEQGLADGALSLETLELINKQLLTMERDWIRPEPTSWFRNMYARSDPNSGYAAQMLPDLRQAVEAKDAQQITAALAAYEAVFDRLQNRMASIQIAMKSTPSQ